MERKILETKWRDIPFEELIEICGAEKHNFTHPNAKEIWEIERRNKVVKVYLPASEPRIRQCNQPLYEVATKIDGWRIWVCSCLVEIGD